MVRKFFTLSHKKKRLLIEALVLSYFAWMKDFSKVKSITPQRIVGSYDLILLKDISWAIKVVSKKVLWKCVCRHQALMATNMYCGLYGNISAGYRMIMCGHLSRSHISGFLASGLS